MGINLKDYGWEEVQATVPGEFFHIPAGAYVCKIVDAHFERVKDKGIALIFDIDIAEGEFTNYFVNLKRPDGSWNFNATFKRYVIKVPDRKVTPTFKGFVELLERQNPHFHFNPENIEEKNFCGLVCGFVFINREYFGRDGKIYSAPTVKFPCDVKKVRAGEVKIPPDEKIPEEQRKQATTDAEVTAEEFNGTPVDDTDFPF